MCGIAGYYSTSQRFDSGTLDAMTKSLAHRGPDHAATFIKEHVGLGHQRLSIIDLSPAANQPMTSRSGRYTITYNGEVYNFKALALELGMETNSDTAVLLEAFHTWGTAFVQRLNGMFAMALYDHQEKELHLWRDRIGIKPLYYFYDGNDFAFASELKALAHLPVQRKLNQEAIADYLFLEYIPEPLTPFQQFYKLEKGHYLKVDQSGLKKTAYFDLLNQIDPKLALHNEQDCIAAFDEQLTAAVRRRTVSDVPVGAFLSGGNDSSAICSKFQEISEQPITGFTIAFDEKRFDESQYAIQVARELGIDHQISTVSAASSLQLVKRIVDHYDEPFAVSSVIPMLQLSAHASKQVKVVLSGDGGDELFMGYGYYRWSERMRHMARFGSIGQKMAANLLPLWGNRGKRAARIFDSKSSSRDWLHLWSQEQYMFTENEITALTGTSYQHQTTVEDHDRIWELDCSTFDKIALFDLRHYLANNLLHKVDIATMAHGLEARVPFLDHEMVTFAINQPHAMKINGGMQKYLLKKWLEKRLPHALVHRTKWGFPAPVEEWLKKELSPLIDQYLAPEALEKSGLFNPSEVQRYALAFRSGAHYHYKRIWALIGFQMWHERYMCTP
jgi:asparagine synthase (glutamine-hydrolysing)